MQLLPSSFASIPEFALSLYARAASGVHTAVSFPWKVVSTFFAAPSTFTQLVSNQVKLRAERRICLLKRQQKELYEKKKASMASIGSAIQTTLQKEPLRIISALEQLQHLDDASVELLVAYCKEEIERTKIERKEAPSVFETIIESYEALKSESATALTPFEALRLSILVAHDVPKVDAIRANLLSGEKGVLRTNETRLPFDVLFNAHEKKIYIITPYVLGKGTQKTAYKAVSLAYDKALGFKNPKLVVYLKTASWVGEAAKKRFETEAAIALAVQDEPCILKTHVARVIDDGKESSTMEMVTEFCDGDLFDVVSAQKPYALSVQEKLQVAIDCITAVRSFHNKGYVHYDVKLENVLLLNKRARLADFGLSFADTKSSYFVEKGIYGTRGHSAPELIASDGTFTGDLKKVDVFALGIVLWTLFTEHKYYVVEEVERLAKEKLEAKAEAGSSCFASRKKALEDSLQQKLEQQYASLLEDDPCREALSIAMKMMSPVGTRIPLEQALVEFERLNSRESS